MSYSTMAHALISYMESHLENFDIKEMSRSFGFSEIYLRELFLKNVNMPIMQYYKRRRMIVSAFEILHSDKKIVDIAFESGFSNHESYTRAFQKIFGMPPSRFRIDRPLIGRKLLVTGVFGLEKLVSKEKRSDEFMMEQDNNETILYGIRKIEQGAYGSNTMFPICIKAVSEYLGDDVSYAYIMAATGAAFRLVWNRATWDLSNIDIYHTLKESNEIYKYGAKALGREFDFIGRDKDTKKEDFVAFIKSKIANGFPVIALGIIGPPEPCIIAGYEASKDVVMGWNFFQNDAMVCICDGRKWGAKYFEELSEKYGETEKAMCQEIVKHFRKVSGIAEEMMSLIGDWNNMENMLENFASKSVREKIGKLIDTAKFEDTMAYEQIKLLFNCRYN